MIVVLTAGIFSLLAATTGVLIAFKIQARLLYITGLEHEAWQREQEARQFVWEGKQRKQAIELEDELMRKVLYIQEQWQRWEEKEVQRLAKLTLEQKLASLPRVEDVPVPSNGFLPSQQVNPYITQSQPPTFFRTNLQGRDLSHRYLQQADFRCAQLENANFYMADLTSACFNGANLTGVNFAGANLSGADLRDAILIDANLLVADLNGAILNGANLLGTHNLAPEQIKSAIFNRDTHIDFELDKTLPHIASVNIKNPKRSSESAPVEFESAIPTPNYNGRAQSKTIKKGSKISSYKQ